ncbi:hypothetical protein K3495_g7331 [Podosphaera aphanis]|nr:hypothetical protein K3495_g7331 [Podosphaera aphanis]
MNDDEELLARSYIADTGANSHVINTPHRYQILRKALPSEYIASGKEHYSIESIGTASSTAHGLKGSVDVTLENSALLIVLMRNGHYILSTQPQYYETSVFAHSAKDNNIVIDLARRLLEAMGHPGPKALSLLPTSITDTLQSLRFILVLAANKQESRKDTPSLRPFSAD